MTVYVTAILTAIFLFFTESSSHTMDILKPLPTVTNQYLWWLWFNRTDSRRWHLGVVGSLCLKDHMDMTSFSVRLNLTHNENHIWDIWLSLDSLTSSAILKMLDSRLTFRVRRCMFPITCTRCLQAARSQVRNMSETFAFE